MGPPLDSRKSRARELKASFSPLSRQCNLRAKMGLERELPLGPELGWLCLNLAKSRPESLLRLVRARETLSLAPNFDIIYC